MCFGNNAFYQLGIAVSSDIVRYPTELSVTFPEGSVVVSAHVNGKNGYAVTANDSVYSWGEGQDGGLGQGSGPWARTIGDSVEPARKVALYLVALNEVFRGSCFRVVK